jgi:hypothetical protein
MSPTPPENTTLAASASGIVSGPAMYLGSNVSVKNTVDGFNTKALPITTESVLNVKSGINVNLDGAGAGKSSLVIHPSGDVDTVGAIHTAGSITTASSVNASSLNIINSSGVQTCTVSDSGLLTLQDNLVIGSTVTVAKATGNFATSGTIYASGSVGIGGTSSAPNVSLSNDGTVLTQGSITAKNNLNIGSNAASDKFVVAASSGNVTTQGTVSAVGAISTSSTISATGAISTGSTVSAVGAISTASTVSATGAISTSSTLSAAGDFSVNSGKFAVTSSTGAVVAHESVTVKNSSESATFTVTASTGDVSVGTGAVNGKITTTYNSYVAPAAASDVLTVDDSVDFSSATSTVLTTQSYVDRAIWKQTKRLNLIVGANDTQLATMTNLMNMANALAGQDAVQTLGTVLDTTSEIKVSMTDVMNTAYNPVIVNCAPSVWADECPPVPIPFSVSNAHSGDGWYFKNYPVTPAHVSASVGGKVNWYLPPNGSEMKMKHIINLFLNVYAVSDLSLPFITVYTQPKTGAGANNLWPIANAKVTFVFAPATTSVVAKKSYTLYTGTRVPANNYNSTPLRCSETATANSTNAYNGNQGNRITVSAGTSFAESFDTSIVSLEDKIAFYSIGTSSNEPIGNIEFVLNSFGICAHDTTSSESLRATNGTTKMMFQNSSVTTNYLYNNLFRKHSNFSALATRSEAIYNAYNAEVFPL